jgi:hypothetical protein
MTLGSGLKELLPVPLRVFLHLFNGFKDVVKLKFMFRDVTVANLLENSVIRLKLKETFKIKM